MGHPPGTRSLLFFAVSSSSDFPAPAGLQPTHATAWLKAAVLRFLAMTITIIIKLGIVQFNISAIRPKTKSRTHYGIGTEILSR